MSQRCAAFGRQRRRGAARHGASHEAGPTLCRFCKKCPTMGSRGSVAGARARPGLGRGWGRGWDWDHFPPPNVPAVPESRSPRPCGSVSTATPSAGRDRAGTPPRAWAPRATASCARAPVRAPADVQRRRRRRRPRKLRPRPCAAVAPLTVVSTSCPHARREQALRREKDLAREILRRHMKYVKCRC